LLTPDPTPQPTKIGQQTVFSARRPPDVKEMIQQDEPLPEVEFGFVFQYTWPVGQVKDISATILSVYPRDPNQWLTDICPECLAFDKQKCSCTIPRKKGYVLSLDLRCKKSSLLSLTAFISGSAAFEIFQKMAPEQLMGYVKDGKKHFFKILKFTPEIITSVPHGFLILEIN